MKKDNDFKLNTQVGKAFDNFYVNIVGDQTIKNVSSDILIDYNIDNFHLSVSNLSYRNILKEFSNRSLEIRKIKHLNDKYFFSKQWEVYNEIVNSKNFRFFIQAATSFGKTMIVNEIIYNHQIKFKKILFVVPTINLRNEISSNLKKILNNSIKILSRLDKENKPEIDNYIIVSTQENIINIDWLQNEIIDLVILDEAYNINKVSGEYKKRDKYSRQLVLNKVMKKYIDNPNQKLIMLSPLIGTISKTTYEYFHNVNINIIRTPFSLTGKKIICKNYNEQIELIKEYLYKEKNIIYINELFRQEEMLNILDSEEKSYESNIVDYILELYPEDWFWIKGYKNGILINNGKIPNYLKRFTINSFINNKDYHTLIANRTVFYGINTPAKNIFILEKIENIVDLKNLFGRAGRYGVYNYGNIFAEIDENEILEKEKKYKFSIDFIDNKDQYKEEKTEKKLHDLIINNELPKSPFSKTNINELIELILEFISTSINNDIWKLIFKKSEIFNNNNKKNDNINLFFTKYFIENVLKSKLFIFNIKHFFNNFSDKFLSYLENHIKKYSWSDLGKQVKKYKTNSDWINFYIDMFTSYIPHKFIPGLELCINIFKLINEKNEFINNHKLKQLSKELNFIYTLITDEFYKVNQNINNKNKYIGIYQDLVELGYLYKDIEKYINYIYNKISDNYETTDLINIMNTLKVYNPFTN